MSECWITEAKRPEVDWDLLPKIGTFQFIDAIQKALRAAGYDLQSKIFAFQALHCSTEEEMEALALGYVRKKEVES